jgi:hypothetical protein
MSYDISSWKTEFISDFTIPIYAIHKLRGVEISLFREDRVIVSDVPAGFEPGTRLLPGNRVVVSGVSAGFKITGRFSGANIVVDEICTSGTRSGSTWDDLLEVFKLSSGTLIAVQVWEGGDSKTRLVVNDGVVSDEEDE